MFVLICLQLLAYYLPIMNEDLFDINVTQIKRYVNGSQHMLYL